MLGGRCPPVTSDGLQPHQRRRSRASLDAAPSRASGFVVYPACSTACPLANLMEVRA